MTDAKKPTRSAAYNQAADEMTILLESPKGLIRIGSPRNGIQVLWSTSGPVIGFKVLDVSKIYHAGMEPPEDGIEHVPGETLDELLQRIIAQSEPAKPDDYPMSYYNRDGDILTVCLSPEDYYADRDHGDVHLHRNQSANDMIVGFEVWGFSEKYKPKA